MTTHQNTTLFTNGHFFNGATSESSFHTSMLVKDGRIVYIGPSDSTSLQAYSHLPTKDLNGQFVLPGFIDGHMHFLMLGQSLAKVELDGCANLTEIRSRISKYAKDHPEKKRILCKGWMHSMTNGEARATMLDDLDERPIYIDS